MSAKAARNTGFLAALILAAVTLGVFFLLQDYGPESAIRRFHNAIETGDSRELQQTVEQPVDPRVTYVLAMYHRALQNGQYERLAQLTDERFSTSNVEVLARRTMWLLANHASYRVARMDRQPRQVRAAVVYAMPNGRRMVMVWVAEKENGVWKVDANKTLTIIRDAMGL